MVNFTDTLPVVKSLDPFSPSAKENTVDSVEHYIALVMDQVSLLLKKKNQACISVLICLFLFICMGTYFFFSTTEEKNPSLEMLNIELGSEKGIGRGTLSSPCTGWSAYTQTRLEETVYPECKKWLAQDVLQETFLSQYNQDAFFFNNFVRCLDGPGVYLDLGAYQPIRWSNTWVLDRCLGWKGLCVEADPVQAEPFLHQRGCTVIAKAVSIQSGKGSLVGGDWGGLVAANYFGEGAKTPISISTLEEILVETGLLFDQNDLNVEESASLLTIDFLSIDIEHNELNAFMSFPWKRINIRFIVVENIFGTRDVEEYLAIQGYVKVCTLEFDDFYAHLESSLPLWRPIASVLGAGGLRREQGYPQYQHEPLYTMGWPKFIKYAEENKELPSSDA